MQTTHSLDNTAVLSGMKWDNAIDQQIVSFVASEAIPAGRMVELASGMVRLPQATGQPSKIVGCALYQASLPPGGYAAGDVVAIMRRGKVVVDWSGTTQTPLALLNVHHSSTVATNRGKVTDAAAAAGAGVEIADGLSIMCFKDPSVSGLTVAELNLP